MPVRHVPPESPPEPPLPPLALRVVTAVLRGVERLLGPGTAAALASWIVRRPPRFDTPEREKAWVEGAEPLELTDVRRVLPGDGAPRSRRLAGWVWSPTSPSAADPPTVVLLHGWGGRGSQMGAFAEPLARAGYRVVAVDAFGHGRSHGRESTLLHFRDSLDRVSRELGPLSAVLAHSLGTAAAAQALAEGVPIERLVFLAPRADLDVYFRNFIRFAGLGRGTYQRLVLRLESRYGFRWEELRRPALDVAQRFPRVPVLVVHDRYDEEIDVREGREVAAAWEQAQILVTEGLGHRRILRDPEVVDRVVAFLGPAAEARRSEAAAAG